jgi:hypothetical protein
MGARYFVRLHNLAGATTPNASIKNDRMPDTTIAATGVTALACRNYGFIDPADSFCFRQLHVRLTKVGTP